MKLAVLIVLHCVFVTAVLSDTPARTPKAKGAAVVAEVSNMIERSGIFPADKRFLCRVAWVESKYGNDKNTYRRNYYGGIWQVDKIAHIDTKTRPSLRKYYSQIKDEFGIDWEKTTWKDLQKPLYSALAARLLLATVPAPIPPETDIVAQGKYWKKHYNKPAGKGTVEKFVADVKASSGCADP